MLGIPNALFVWAAVSVLVVVILQRTPLGRYIYAIGNKEAAAYLAGVNTRRVTVICFVLCGLAAALAGVLLAGYSTKAYQAMGDTYLLPSIAAVVIGGTNILGGRGRYLGTLVGVVLIVLLNSVLSIMADARGRPADDLRSRHHPDAARLWPRRTRDELKHDPEKWTPVFRKDHA